MIPLCTFGKCWCALEHTVLWLCSVSWSASYDPSCVVVQLGSDSGAIPSRRENRPGGAGSVSTFLLPSSCLHTRLSVSSHITSWEPLSYKHCPSRVDVLRDVPPLIPR